MSEVKVPFEVGEVVYKNILRVCGVCLQYKYGTISFYVNNNQSAICLECINRLKTKINEQR